MKEQALFSASVCEEAEVTFRKHVMKSCRKQRDQAISARKTSSMSLLSTMAMLNHHHTNMEFMLVQAIFPPAGPFKCKAQPAVQYCFEKLGHQSVLVMSLYGNPNTLATKAYRTFPTQKLSKPNQIYF